MKICVASPYPLTSLKGNTVTANRIVEVLRGQGLEARASNGFDGEEADVLIALHAHKGAGAVREYLEKFPEGKVVVFIAGTDLYHDLPNGSEEALESLRRADGVALMHDGAMGSLPEEFREKAQVVWKTIPEVDLKARPQREPFAISVIGHLRPVKRPFAAMRAVAERPEWAVEVWQVGEALDEESEAEALRWGVADSRYRWFGGVPREEALERLSRSALTINSSVSEGGASAVLEAMQMGVPVLASRIEGNVGLLGADYPGYYDEGELGEKLGEILDGEVELGGWVLAAKSRLPLFTEEKEAACWLELLEKLR